MNRIISAVLTASALIFGVFLPREEAVAQTAKDLVGTWTLVSVTLEQDGKKTDFYGPNPQGQVTFDPNGPHVAHHHPVGSSQIRIQQSRGRKSGGKQVRRAGEHCLLRVRTR